MKMFFHVAYSLVICLFWGLPGTVLSDGTNYPDGQYNRKPCLRRKNTIQFQGPICQQSLPNQFIDESVKNCEEAFRSTCPEFNGGSCELCNISQSLFNGSKSGTVNLGCCKLYYKAQKYTWAEIFYVNQYAPTDANTPVYDIVEIRRNVINTGAFGERNQADWPGSVIDPNGERGLPWKTKDMPGLPTMDTKSEICSTPQDARCDSFLTYLRNNWTDGFDFDAEHNINPTQAEVDHMADINNELAARCMPILINMIRTSACQVVYTRRARYNYTTNQDTSSLVPITRLHDSSFEFLEVQLYNSPKEKFTVRYAYWNQEPTETRDEIFSNGS